LWRSLNNSRSFKVILFQEAAAKHPHKPIVDVPAGGEYFELVYKVMGGSSVPMYNLPREALGVEGLKALRQSVGTLNYIS